MDSPTTPPGLPRRPALRPGLRVVRRDQRLLQVGIDPPLRVIVADGPGVWQLLRALETGAEAEITSEEAAAALRSLVRADLVVDVDGPRTDRSRAHPAAVSAAWAAFGSEAATRLDARSAARIGVRAPATARHDVAALLRASGLRLAGSHDPVSAWLVVAEGVLARDELDSLVREGDPHLLVTGVSGEPRLGPFVLPGHTACLRCVDAHESQADPRRHLVIEQVARAGAQTGTEPRDPVLEALALAWAVRDLTRYVEGDRPSTWSATVDIDTHGAPRHQVWSRHPHCGCAWDELLAGVPS